MKKYAERKVPPHTHTRRRQSSASIHCSSTIHNGVSKAVCRELSSRSSTAQRKTLRFSVHVRTHPYDAANEGPRLQRGVRRAVKNVVKEQYSAVKMPLRGVQRVSVSSTQKFKDTRTTVRKKQIPPKPPAEKHAHVTSGPKTRDPTQNSSQGQYQRKTVVCSHFKAAGARVA